MARRLQRVPVRVELQGKIPWFIGKGNSRKLIFHIKLFERLFRYKRASSEGRGPARDKIFVGIYTSL